MLKKNTKNWTISKGQLISFVSVCSHSCYWSFSDILRANQIFARGKELLHCYALAQTETLIFL